MNIGIVAEAKWEVRQVCDRLGLTPVIPRDDNWGGALHGHTVHLCVSGLVPTVSIERVHRFFNMRHLDLVLCAGLVGALRPNIQIGDLIVQSEDSRLIRTAEIALKEIGLPFHIGSLVTVPIPVFTPADRHKLGAVSQALAVDLDSQTLIALCRQRSTPYLVLKTISDSLEDDLSSDIVDLHRAASEVVESPSTWPLALGLARHSTLATKNLAEALWALLMRLCKASTELDGRQ